jgi:ADP-L-glycero-D-manno-heptose 6-epimerase
MRVIVTGGAGFIGSAMVWQLNRLGVEDVIVTDLLGTDAKWKNLVPLRFSEIITPETLLKDPAAFDADAIVHMGACSATTERDASYLLENNYRYTKTLAEYAVGKDIRFIYASSAATYGAGEHGFDDDPEMRKKLAPLNMYGYSKQLFDLYAERTGLLQKIVGLKFFNVFGPNEYHKESMTSVPHNAFHTVQTEGVIRLFKSYREDYQDGEQVRDFIYVKDVTATMAWLLANPAINGLYNLGTGQARSWNALAKAVFAAVGKPENIEYIPMPDNLIGQYQYKTEASMERLQSAGCPVNFHDLEDTIRDYVQGYLLPGDAVLNPDEP